jgi:hypothetical protein
VEGAPAEDAAPCEPEQPAQVVAVEADHLDSQQVAASSADVLKRFPAVDSSASPLSLATLGSSAKQ